MKYIIREGTLNGKYNAISKARMDCEKIFLSNDYRILDVNSKYPIRHGIIGKIKQGIHYIHNDLVWIKLLNSLKEGDIVAIQYPLNNKCMNIPRIIKKFNKKINFLLLIHDVDSIRYKDKVGEHKITKIRRLNEEVKIINNSNYVIIHNHYMKEKILEMGVNNHNLIELEIFDYLIPNKIINNSKSDGIIIAGNLSRQKAKFIDSLYTIKNVKFNLYGVGYEPKEEDHNISYKGSFLPAELPFNLEGKYGLIWDGDNINICTGTHGNYMRYNNPHKISLYLVSKIPAIVWNKSAAAEFVKENNVGIAVDSLVNLETELNKISETKYKEMKKNCNKIAKKLSKGYYLSKAIKTIEKEIV